MRKLAATRLANCDARESRWRRCALPTCAAALILWANACATRHTEETVITQARPVQREVLPSQMMSSVSSPSRQNALPVRDIRIERAGDAIAAAIIHLRGHRYAVARRSLDEAETALRLAMRDNEFDSSAHHDEIESVLREVEIAKRNISHAVSSRTVSSQIIPHLRDACDALDRVNLLAS